MAVIYLSFLLSVEISGDVLPVNNSISSVVPIRQLCLVVLVQMSYSLGFHRKLPNTHIVLNQL